MSFTSALKERKERLSPEEANKLRLSRIEKIDFKGKPVLREHKPTKTGMIIVRRGDVLISGINADKGAVCVFNEADEATATIHYSAYEIDPSLASPEFLEWFLRSKYFQNALIEQVGGGIKTEIKAKKFLSINIPIPNKETQLKIIKRLDIIDAKVTEFKLLEKENIKLADHLEKLILMKVIGLPAGETWTANEPYALPDDWEWRPLHELLIDKPRNGYSPSAVSYETNVKTLKLAATTSGKFKGREHKFIAEDIPEDSYLWLEPNDILLQRSNSIDYVGVSAIYTEGPHEFIYPDLMMKLKTTDEILPEYLHLVLSSPFIRNYYRNTASGTSGNMPKINQKIVMASMIPVPPFPTQSEVIKEAASLLSKLEELVEVFNEQKTLLPSLVESSITMLLNKNWASDTVVTQNHNLSFSIQQATAALLNRGFNKGEMAIAKALYLLQEVYKVDIGITFTAQSFGPYDGSVRKALTSGLTTKNKFFKKSGNSGREYFELESNGTKILKYTLAQETDTALDKLFPVIENAGSRDIERLATVCKIIQDQKTVDASIIKSSMHEWKADKFADDEIEKSLKYILSQDWQEQLISR
jgi:type I restriction enzyme, S subunit